MHAPVGPSIHPSTHRDARTVADRISYPVPAIRRLRMTRHIVGKYVWDRRVSRIKRDVLLQLWTVQSRNGAGDEQY
jgi:hypothetical protein